MAERSIIFPSEGGSLDIVEGDIIVTPGDRVVEAVDWQHAMRSVAGDGFVPGLDDGLRVVPTTPATKDVQVSLGAGWVRGAHYRSHSTATLVDNHSDNAGEGNPRIDRLVLRLDPAERRVSAVTKEGTPAADPEPPALTQDPVGVWEVPLAQLVWPAGATSLHEEDDAPSGQGEIVDDRQPSLSPVAAVHPILEGTLSATGPFVLTLPDWAVGQYHRIDVSLRGAVDTSSNIRLRPNDENTAGLYRWGFRASAAAAAEPAVAGHSPGDSSGWRLARWGEPTGNQVDIRIYETDRKALLGYQSWGSRTSATAALHQESRGWGRLNESRVLRSMQIHPGVEATQFASIRWRVDGIS